MLIFTKEISWTHMLFLTPLSMELLPEKLTCLIMVHGEMHYHKKKLLSRGGVSESVQNQVHTTDYVLMVF